MKSLSPLIIILSAILPLTLLGQTSLQDKLDNVVQLAQDNNLFGVLSVMNDIDDECKHSSDNSILLQYYYFKGCLYYKIDKYDEAIPLLQEYISLCDQLDYRPLQYLDALRTLGHCYKDIKDYSKAARFYRKTMLLGTEAFEEFPEMASEVLFGLASVFQAQNDTSQIDEFCDLGTEYSVKDYIMANGENEIVTAYHKACQDLAEAEKAQGKGSESYIQALLGKADVLRSMEAIYAYFHYYSQAISIGKTSIGLDNRVFYPYYDELIHIMSQTDSINHINELLPIAFDYWKSMNDTTQTIYGKYIVISIGLNSFGFYQHSLDYSLKCEEYLKDHQDLYNWKSASFLNNLNLLEAYAGLHDTNRMAYYRNELMALSDISYTDETICSYLMGLCGKALNDCKFELAKEYCTITLKELDKALGINNIYYIQILNQRGISSLYLNLLDEALKDFSDAFQLCDIQELKDAIYPSLYNNIGKTYMLKKEYAEALHYLDLAVKWQIKINGTADVKTQSYIEKCKNKL